MADTESKPPEREESASNAGDEHEPYAFAEEEEPGAPVGASDRRDDTPGSRSGGAEAGEIWSPILLEGEDITECPNCGAPMPGDDEVICLRCGFDLVGSRTLEVQTGVQEVAPEPEEEEAPKPVITPPGFGDLQAPAIIAGAAFLIMTIAYLIGWRGLFRDEIYQERLSIPPWGDRLRELLQFYLVTLVLGLALWIGLQFLARLEKREVGDAALSAVRCLAIVALCQLLILLPQPFGYWGLEFFMEFILRAAAVLGLLMLAFNLTFRDAMVVAICAILIGSALKFISTLIEWAF